MNVTRVMHNPNRWPNWVVLELEDGSTIHVRAQVSQPVVWLITTMETDTSEPVVVLS